MRRISDLSNRSAQSRQSRFSRDSTALMSAIGSLLCCRFWRRADAELEVVAVRHQLLLPPLRQAPAAANPRADARAGRLRHAILRFVLIFEFRPAILLTSNSELQ